MERSVRVRIASGALAVGIAAMLTGCFANPLDAIIDNASEDGAKQVAEELVEEMTGGETKVEIGRLPEDFPAEITLVSENVVQSISMADGMMVVVSDPRGMDELLAQVKSDFSGWEEVALSDLGEMVSAMYKKDESLSVGVAIMAESEGEDATVGYTVIKSE